MDKETLYRRLLGTVPDMVLLLDAEGRYLEVFAADDSVLPAPRDEMIGRTLDDVLSRAKALELRAVIDDVIATGEVRVLEHRMQRDDGERRYEARLAPLDLADGRCVAVVSRDVTERERLARQLRDSERRYRTIVDNAPDAIVLLDVENRRFEEVNERAVELAGMTRDELRAVGPAELSPPRQPDGRASAERIGELLALALAGERPVFDWMVRSAAGEDILCEIRLVRMPSAERMLVLVSGFDVRERRALESEMRRCRERCQRLAASDLREIAGELATLSNLAGENDRLRAAVDKLDETIDALIAELDAHQG